MATIVGVQFQKNGKIYNFDANNLEIKQNDYVIVDTAHGIDIGQAAVGSKVLEENDSKIPLKKVIRLADEQDIKHGQENRVKEKEAFAICQKKIAEHKLEMKLVSVEYAFDNSKILFFFTANGRVDFRSLVKDLASIFKMRIELRQIGVRDEARMLGGLGPCGRPICCRSFLDEFQPVSIKMAKEQNLSLNPTKISGVCGRLMCCLKYEQDHYEQTRKLMPRIGKEVITPDGNGTVSDLNIVKETVFVRITNGDSSEIKEYPLEKIERTANTSAAQHAEKADQPSDNPEGNPTSPEQAETPSDNRKNNYTESGQNRHQKRGKPANQNSSGKNKEQRKAEKNDSARQNPALGKPVMRENPNRNTQKPAAEPSVPETKEEKSSNWAEAVRKAIDSMN